MIVTPAAYRGHGLCVSAAACLCTAYNHVDHSGAGNYRESDRTCVGWGWVGVGGGGGGESESIASTTRFVFPFCSMQLLFLSLLWWSEQGIRLCVFPPCGDRRKRVRGGGGGSGWGIKDMIVSWCQCRLSCVLIGTCWVRVFCFEAEEEKDGLNVRESSDSTDAFFSLSSPPHYSLHSLLLLCSLFLSLLSVSDEYRGWWQADSHSVQGNQRWVLVTSLHHFRLGHLKVPPCSCAGGGGIQPITELT